MKKTVAAFGEILWDILPTATILGGAPFNFTYRINSLGDRGIMLSRIGRDDLGRSAYEAVVSLGLETDYIQQDDDNPTGTVRVSFDEAKNPDYVIIPDVAYDYMEPTDSFLAVGAEADCICFGTLAQRAMKSRETLEQLLERFSGSLKFLDINLRKDCFSEKTILFSLNSADVLKMNDDEVHQLARILNISCETIPVFCAKIIEKFSLRYCLVTLGKNGVYAREEYGDSVYIPGFRVDLVDSLGSGDAFSAGFVQRILHGASMREACELGNMLGALVASKKGGTTPVYPEEIRDFRTLHSERKSIEELEKYI